MSHKGDRQTPSGYAGIRWTVNIIENLAIELYSGQVELHDHVLGVLRQAVQELEGLRRGRHGTPTGTPGITGNAAQVPGAGAGGTPVFASPVAYGNVSNESVGGGSYTSDCPWKTCEDDSCRPACEIIIKVTSP